MTNYKIIVADSLEFENSAISAGTVKYSTAVDLPGAELSVDVFGADVDYEVGATVLWTPQDYDGIITADGYLFGCEELDADITETPYGSTVLFYGDGVLIGKYFLKNIVRVGKTKYQINAMSAIGFLDNQRHMGGLYQNVTCADVIDEIVNGAFDYSVDPAIASQSVVGWLPIATRRENLHQLMFALGFSLTKDENGDISFVFLQDGDGKLIGDNRIFIGGSVDYQSPATAVDVTEHSYYALASDAEEQLFDNIGKSAASSVLVEFSEPHHDLVATSGLTIDSYGVNYAYVSGNGVLTGKKYTHNTQTIRHALRSAMPNVITCDNCTLVNTLNSENVARRLLAYYGSRKTVRADMKVDGEKSGDLIRFSDAFGEMSKGIITQMETVASSFLRAACQIITDYVPTGQGNFYSNRILVTESGTITLPAGVTRIRLVLIAGGDGGDGGFDGEHGKGALHESSAGDFDYVVLWWDEEREYCTSIGYVYSGGNQGLAKGGAAGERGQKGKIWVADLDVVDGAQLTFAIGAGGAGGASNGGLGTAGGETSVSGGLTASSANGQYVNGYVDPFTGDIYAADGQVGYDGGDGGQTDAQSLYAANGKSGFNGGDAGEWKGGNGGSGIEGADPNDYDSNIPNDWYWFNASGGGGGGAAYGANGGNGGNGIWYKPSFEAPYVEDCSSGGAGGDGANAVQHEKPLYGCGGGGGNGGGGGGNAGGARTDTTVGPMVYGYFYPDQMQSGGAGGLGSAGGDGGDGCAIIYY